MQYGNQTLDGYLDRLDAAARRFGDVLATGDLGARVPACPGWTLAELGAHLGEVHRWAEHAITAGNPDAPPVEAPAGQAELAEWYRRSAESLGATLRRTDPDAPVWHFGPRPRTARFWFRRQAHEVTIHLADALASQGSSLTLDDDEFAADGVSEVVMMFLPRQQRLGRLTDTSHLLSLGSGPDWWLVGDTEGKTEPDATVSGPPEALLFLVWGRIALDDPRLEVTGDREAARVVLKSGLVP